MSCDACKRLTQQELRRAPCQFCRREAAPDATARDLAEAAALIAELLVTHDDPAVFAEVRVRARHWLREYAATRPFTH